MRSLTGLAAAALLGSMLLTGCGDGDDPAESAAGDRGAATQVEDRGADCTTAPDGDDAGPDADDAVGWARDAADEVEAALDGPQVRFCIDPAGMPHLFVVLDEAPPAPASTCRTAVRAVPASIEEVTSVALAVGDEVTDCA